MNTEQGMGKIEKWQDKIYKWCEVVEGPDCQRSKATPHTEKDND